MYLFVLLLLVFFSFFVVIYLSTFTKWQILEFNLILNLKKKWYAKIIFLRIVPKTYHIILKHYWLKKIMNLHRRSQTPQAPWTRAQFSRSFCSLSIDANSSNYANNFRQSERSWSDCRSKPPSAFILWLQITTITKTNRLLSIVTFRL